MTFAIIFLGVALVVSLAFNFGFFRPRNSARSSTALAPTSLGGERASPGSDDRLERAEADLQKKRKELEEIRRSNTELKDELKSVKKRLFENKEAGKGDDDLLKARAEAERQASIQLDATRHELAGALAEIQKLKAQAESKGKKREERPEEPKKEVVIQKVVRELSDVEKERIARLEQQSTSDRKKAIELSSELRSIKGKIDREKREAKRVYEEGRLARDKFRAVEIRLNRTLLENDMLKRALSGLEKSTGQHADRTQLTAEEIAESDARMKAKYAAEDRAAEEAERKLQAAEATGADAAPGLEPEVKPPPPTMPAAVASASQETPPTPPTTS